MASTMFDDSDAAEVVEEDDGMLQAMHRDGGAASDAALLGAGGLLLGVNVRRQLLAWLPLDVLGLAFGFLDTDR